MLFAINAKAMGVALKDVRSAIMEDLRQIEEAVVQRQAVIYPQENSILRQFSDFAENDRKAILVIQLCSIAFKLICLYPSLISNSSPGLPFIALV
jgi:hypothetical protein